jgi:hypothetical protein
MQMLQLRLQNLGQNPLQQALGKKAGRGSGIKNFLVIVDTATLSVLHVLNNCALNVGSIAVMVIVP